MDYGDVYDSVVRFKAPDFEADQWDEFTDEVIGRLAQIGLDKSVADVPPTREEYDLVRTYLSFADIEQLREMSSWVHLGTARVLSRETGEEAECEASMTPQGEILVLDPDGHWNRPLAEDEVLYNGRMPQTEQVRGSRGHDVDVGQAISVKLTGYHQKLGHCPLFAAWFPEHMSYYESSWQDVLSKLRSYCMTVLLNFDQLLLHKIRGGLPERLSRMISQLDSVASVLAWLWEQSRASLVSNYMRLQDLGLVNPEEKEDLYANLNQITRAVEKSAQVSKAHPIVPTCAIALRALTKFLADLDPSVITEEVQGLKVRLGNGDFTSEREVAQELYRVLSMQLASRPWSELIKSKETIIEAKPETDAPPVPIPFTKLLYERQLEKKNQEERQAKGSDLINTQSQSQDAPAMPLGGGSEKDAANMDPASKHYQPLQLSVDPRLEPDSQGRKPDSKTQPRGKEGVVLPKVEQADSDMNGLVGQTLPQPQRDLKSRELPNNPPQPNTHSQVQPQSKIPPQSRVYTQDDTNPRIHSQPVDPLDFIAALQNSGPPQPSGSPQPEIHGSRQQRGRFRVASAYSPDRSPEPQPQQISFHNASLRSHTESSTFSNGPVPDRRPEVSFSGASFGIVPFRNYSPSPFQSYTARPSSRSPPSPPSQSSGLPLSFQGASNSNQNLTGPQSQSRRPLSSRKGETISFHSAANGNGRASPGTGHSTVQADPGSPEASRRLETLLNPSHVEKPPVRNTTRATTTALPGDPREMLPRISTGPLKSKGWTVHERNFRRRHILGELSIEEKRWARTKGYYEPEGLLDIKSTPYIQSKSSMKRPKSRVSEVGHRVAAKSKDVV